MREMEFGNERGKAVSGAQKRLAWREGNERCMKGDSKHFLRTTRFAIPFLLPIWMIAYPIWCYKSECGTFFQSEADRQVYSVSSGPWSHDVLIVLMMSFLFALCFHSACLIYSLIRRRWLDVWFWLGGSIMGLGTTWLTVYLFGNLLDI